MDELRNIMIGYEIGEKKSQICYYDRKEQDAISIPVKTGGSEYEFMNCLCKKEGADEWRCGLEAEYFSTQVNWYTVNDLYAICQKTDPVPIEEQMYEPWKLMGIFIRESLALLSLDDPITHISGMMITVKSLSREMVQNLRRACEFAGFTMNQYFIQDFDESFYYHTFYQRPEVWSRKVALFRFHDGQVSYEELSHDPNARPVTVTLVRGETIDLSPVPRDRDMQFYQLIEDSFKGEVYSGVFLVGEEFDKEWAARSVALLCRNNRRVFHGNNLFAKGACYAVKEKLEDHLLKGYQYEGRDLIRTNIGMEMIISGAPAYYSLIMSGINWYEASKECEIILDDTKELIFFVHHMDSGERTRYCMELPGLPDRPNKTTRIRLTLEYVSTRQCRIAAEDLGFGEMYPTSGRNWAETLEV